MIPVCIRSCIYNIISFNLQPENEDTIIYDADDGYIKSLEDLAAESIYDEKEKRPVVKAADTLPQAPDGGYGWVICCGVFLNHMIYGKRLVRM